LRAPLPAELTPAQTAEWNKWRKQGKEASEIGDWRKALDAYQKAWAIKQDWNLAANLGRAELNMYRFRDAAEHLENAVRTVPPDLATRAPDEWNNLREMQRKARAKVGALVIKVEPPGAEVLVNGLPVGNAPLPDPVFVEPGQVAVEARADGYALGNASVKLVQGREETITLRLAGIAPVGKKAAVEKNPALPTAVPEKRSVVPGVVLGSVAGAALVTGIGLYAGGRAKASSASNLHDAILQDGHTCISGATSYDTRCGNLESTASTSNTLQRSGVGLLVGAGAATAGTVIYFVLPPAGSSKSSSGAVRITPMVSLASAGMVFSGSF
jgi:hypothetical protein